MRVKYCAILTENRMVLFVKLLLKKINDFIEVHDIANSLKLFIQWILYSVKV